MAGAGVGVARAGGDGQAGVRRHQQGARARGHPPVFAGAPPDLVRSPGTCRLNKITIRVVQGQHVGSGRGNGKTHETEIVPACHHGEEAGEKH